jgi:3-hydroxyisobutyrate dehydrogenase
MTAKPRIGFVGLGNMGAPMAENLLKAGFELAVADADPGCLADFANRAALPASLAELGRTSDLVVTMLPDGKIVRKVLCGSPGSNDGILAGLAAGSLVIDMSSSAPVGTRELGAALAARGVALVDAPVSGGVKRAADGTLAIMVGGEANAFERARPLFELMGKKITHMGAPGAGQMTKLANQIGVALALEAAAEAIKFAKAGGLDAARMVEAIGGGAAGSWQLSNLGPKIIAGDYRPGFFIKLIRKDLRLVAEAARESGLALPGLALMTSMFNSAAALGHDLDGTQAVAAALDRVADVK